MQPLKAFALIYSIDFGKVIDVKPVQPLKLPVSIVFTVFKSIDLIPVHPETVRDVILFAVRVTYGYFISIHTSRAGCDSK